MVPTGKGNLASFSMATPSSKTNLTFITHQLLYRLRQPAPQPRAAPRSYLSPDFHEITFIFTKDYFGPMQKHDT